MKLDRSAPNVDCQYGFGWRGIDPRNFDPDRESCTPAELARHAADCQRWADAEAEGIDLSRHSPSDIRACTQEAHAAAGGWGIGTYWFIVDEHGEPTFEEVRASP